MSGPIVRTGTTPEYWKNWDQAFGKKSASEGGAKKKAGAGTAKSGKAEAAGKATKKTAKKAGKKKK